jgi:hypothetical protein
VSTPAPCPPWCEDSEEHGAVHRTARTTIDRPGDSTHLSTRAGLFGAGPEVVVHASWNNPANSYRRDAGADLYVPVADAGQLAGLVKVLAHASPEQHLELAAGIEQAAAQIEAEA